MGMLWKIATLPIWGPIRGITWIAEQVLEQAEGELYDEDKIRGRLMELEMRYDAGEISEAEYDAEENELLERLKIARERAAGDYES
jgi:hypothetical protein